MRYFVIFVIALFPLTINAVTLKKLDFQHNKTFDDKKLYDVLGLKTPAFYQLWKDKEPKVNEKIIPSLQEALEFFYKSEGFYHAKIQRDETNTTVTFKINSGDAVYVKSINLEGDDKLKDMISFKKGSRFRSLEFGQIKKDIKAAMLKKGYCNYNLDSKARVDIEKDIVFLDYKLQKNPPCKFGKITITSPKNIDKNIIKSRLLFKEGDTYSLEKVNRSYSMVSGLEAFDEVMLHIDKKSDLVNIGLNLKEKRKKTRIELGVGYETDIGPRGILRYEKRNFIGDAKKIAFDLKYSQKEKHITNTVYWPAFVRVPIKGYYYLDLKNDFTFSEILFENFTEKKISNFIHLLKDYDWYSVDFGLGYERINIKKTGEMCGIKEGNFNLLFPFGKIHIDLRDSKIDPRNGLYFSQYIESGLDILSNSSTYLKSETEARVIKTIQNFTFAAKGKIGLIKEYAKQLPESKLFFAGGAFSNRGYSYNSLGAFDASCAEIGGKTLIDTTLEVSHPAYKKLDVALFLDSTLISQNSSHFSIDFVHSIGTGVRYNSAIGPVKLDIGMDIDKHSQYAIHFQIGQSF